MSQMWSLKALLAAHGTFPYNLSIDFKILVNERVFNVGSTGARRQESEGLAVNAHDIERLLKMTRS